MTNARSWLAAGAAAVITGSVVGIVTAPVTSVAGIGLVPTAVLDLPTSRGPSPTKTATPAPGRGSPSPVPGRGSPSPVPTPAMLGDPVRTPPAPTGLVIPALDIDQRIAPVGVRADGLMEVPEDPQVAGWYRFGSAPSDPTGAVVLAAHVDSRQFGIGPFAQLSRLRQGQEVIVQTDAGEVVYRVTDLQIVGKDALPLDAVFDRGGGPRLHLLTCAGTFSSQTGWDSNLVVVASPVQ